MTRQNADQVRDKLLDEVQALRQRVTQLETAEAAQQQAEAALQERDRRYQSFVENSLGLIYIHDLEGTLVWVNPAAALALGYTPQDLAGRHLRTVLVPSVCHLCNAYLQRIQQQAVDTGQMRMVAKDGTERVWTYRHVLYEEPGKAPYVIGHAQDITEHIRSEQDLKKAYWELEQRVQERTAALQQEITERKRVEEELRASEERYRNLVENASDIVYTHTTNGTFTSFNAAGERLTGYTCQEVLHLNIVDLVAPQHRSMVQEMLANKLFEAPLPIFQLALVTKEGRHVAVEVNAQPILKDGKVTEIQGTARDITARQHLEERLLEAQKMEAIGTLAGGIAHDFNNRLNAILGFTELALLGIAEQRPVERHLRRVLKAGTLAKDLVQQILTFSRQRAPQHAAFPLSRLVDESLRLIRASLPSTIDIHTHIEEESGLVLADPVQLQQILLNLCSNAEYAMRPGGGVLEVGLQAFEASPVFAASHPGLQPGPVMRLSIRDTGHGMSPEILQHIFEPFFTTKGPGDGTGMGLAVIHGIVTNHGGAITVSSTPGVGTTFEVYLPRYVETPRLLPETLPEAARSKGRVLFVDDEEVLAEMAREMLTHLGYQTTVFTSSPEALEAFTKAPQHYDLVITDQTMPQMTGEMLAAELRQVRPNIPIILCTGYSHVLDEEKALSLGIDAFCMKPVSMPELADTIEQILMTRRAIAVL